MKRYYAVITDGISQEDMRVFLAFKSKMLANHASIESQQA